jgi:hypothetical protein
MGKTIRLRFTPSRMRRPGKRRRISLGHKLSPLFHSSRDLLLVLLLTVLLPQQILTECTPVEFELDE